MVTKEYSVDFSDCLMVTSILKSISVRVLKGVGLSVEALAGKVWLHNKGIFAYFSLLYFGIVKFPNSVFSILFLNLVFFILFADELFLFFRNLQVHDSLSDSQHGQPLDIHQTQLLCFLFDLL